MSLPYPYYTEPHDKHAEVEAVATLWHADGTTTTHGLLMTAPVYDEHLDLLEAWDECSFQPADPSAFNAAMGEDVELGELEVWDGISPEFDKMWPPSESTLRSRAAREALA